jgi:hypothetical protein
MTVFSYPSIPRHYEEALLLCQSLFPNQAIDLKGLRIRHETAERFGQFTRTMAQYKGNLPAAYHALRAEFGDTFWFYFQFQETPGRVSGGRR